MLRSAASPSSRVHRWTRSIESKPLAVMSSMAAVSTSWNVRMRSGTVHLFDHVVDPVAYGCTNRRPLGERHQRARALRSVGFLVVVAVDAHQPMLTEDPT